MARIPPEAVQGVGLRALAFGPPTGADVATVSSARVLVRDGRRVYETHVVLHGDGPDGLQSQAYGWVPAMPQGALLEFVKRFEVLRPSEVPPWAAGTPCIIGSVAR